MFQKGNQFGRRFKPGQSGNPLGRCKSEIELRAAIQLEGMALFNELKRIAYNSADEGIRVRAIKELFDRGYGRPPESVKISGDVRVEERKRVILEDRGASAN